MNKDFYSVIKDRRSYYGISKESPISDERIQEIVEFTLKYTPSAFNSQSARIVMLLNKDHDKLWSITKEALRKIVPAEKFASTDEKINSFANGYGTILFFEDKSIIDYLQNQFPSYAANFPIWSQQSNGMHQLVIWAGLEAEGLGASLQHYNELIEEDIKKEWSLPEEWKLIAQMPFGKPTSMPGEKEFNPIQERMKVFK